MPKRICILIFGLFIAQPFTASAISVESDSDSDTDLQLTKLASRNVLDSDESSKTVEDIRRITLIVHNKYCALHCAPALQLDDAINLSAQNYAKLYASMNTLQHNRTPGLGEHLALAMNSRAIASNGADAVHSWYPEISMYNFNLPGSSKGTGHSTKVIWKGSQKVGVVFALTKGGATIYTVAQYSPERNYIDKKGANVLPGSSC